MLKINIKFIPRNLIIVFISFGIAINVNSMYKSGLSINKRSLFAQNSRASNLFLSSIPNHNLYLSTLPQKIGDNSTSEKNKAKYKKLFMAAGIFSFSLADYHHKNNESKLSNIIKTKYSDFDSSNINKENALGQTLLMEAIDNYDIETVQLIIQCQSLDINVKNKYGNTALIKAATNGCKEIVKMLIVEGADINIQDEMNNTALINATMHGHKKIVKALLKNGATADLQNISGKTALYWAAYFGHKEIAKILLDYDANIYIKNTFDNTALIIAAANGHKKIVEILCNSSQVSDIITYINEQDYQGNTALMKAAANGHNDVVKILLDYGADVTTRSLDGNSALQKAASECHLEIVQLLLKSNNSDLGDINEALILVKHSRISRYDSRYNERFILKKEIAKILEQEALTLLKKLPNIAYERLKILKGDNNYIKSDEYVNFLSSAYDQKEIECDIKSQSCAHLKIMRSYDDIDFNKDMLDLIGKLYRDFNLYTMLYDMHNVEQKFNVQNIAVFVHGQKKMHAFFEDIYTALVSKVCDITIPDNYLYIRYLNKEDHRWFNLFKLIIASFERRKLMNNNRKVQRHAELLFMNAFIAGGYFLNHPSCSLKYFFKNMNIYDPNISMKDVFEKLGIDHIYSKYHEELKELQELYYQLNPYGRILQIAIPYSILDNIVYLSSPSGQRMTFENRDKEYYKASELIKDIKENPENFKGNYKLDSQEFVLVLTKDLALNPNSGIKIIPYETMAYADKESKEYSQYQEYLKRFNEIIDSIAQDAVNQK